MFKWFKYISIPYKFLQVCTKAPIVNESKIEMFQVCERLIATYRPLVICIRYYW